MEMGEVNLKSTGDVREAYALCDELDMLQEEKESVLEKLRFAEESCQKLRMQRRGLRSLRSRSDCDSKKFEDFVGSKTVIQGHYCYTPPIYEEPSVRRTCGCLREYRR